MKDWTTCPSCEEEYQVIGGSIDNDAKFCPFCGDEVPDDDDEQEAEEEW